MRAWKIFFLIGSAAVVYFFLAVYVRHIYVAQNYRVQKEERKNIKLLQELAELRNTYAHLTGPGKMRHFAVAHGFSPINHRQIIDLSQTASTVRSVS